MEPIQFADNGKQWTIRLHRTTGVRNSKAKPKSAGFKQTCLVLYFNVEHAWGSQNLRRNGNGYGTLLCMAQATPEAREYHSFCTRAHSLRYNGLGKANAQGLADDLRWLGYDDTTVERFLEAAKPHWPIEVQLSTR